MKQKAIIPLVLLYVSCFIIAGCGKNKIPDSYLVEIESVNTLETLTQKNGKILYLIEGYMKNDKRKYEQDVYKDSARYITTDASGTLVIENGSAYGVNRETNRPYRYLFPGTYETFQRNEISSSFYKADEGEHIISSKEEGDLIYLETKIPIESCGYICEAFGYTTDEVEHVEAEYEIDAKTREILSLKSYIVKDDKKILFLEQKLDRGSAEYNLLDELKKPVFGDEGSELKTVVAITDAGTPQEKRYQVSAAEGCDIIIYYGNEYEPVLYADPECTREINPESQGTDMTGYLKKTTQSLASPR